MCKALEELEERGRQEGRLEGRLQGQIENKLKLIVKKIHKNKSFDQIVRPFQVLCKLKKLT